MKQIYTKFYNTHIGGLLVVINVVDISCQAEVSYFHHIVLCYQNVTSSQVSVDALKTKKHVEMVEPKHLEIN